MGRSSVDTVDWPEDDDFSDACVGHVVRSRRRPSKGFTSSVKNFVVGTQRNDPVRVSDTINGFDEKSKR